MIYVPNLDNACTIIYDNNTIRTYDTIPKENTDIDYTDYYYNSHYLSKNGVEHIINVPTCLDKNILTNDFYYRNDLDNILVIFIIISFIGIYIPIKIFSLLFKKRGI